MDRAVFRRAECDGGVGFCLTLHTFIARRFEIRVFWTLCCPMVCNGGRVTDILDARKLRVTKGYGKKQLNTCRLTFQKMSSVLLLCQDVTSQIENYAKISQIFMIFFCSQSAAEADNIIRNKVIDQSKQSPANFQKFIDQYDSHGGASSRSGQMT